MSNRGLCCECGKLVLTKEAWNDDVHPKLDGYCKGYKIGVTRYVCIRCSQHNHVTWDVNKYRTEGQREGLKKTRK